MKSDSETNVKKMMEHKTRRIILLGISYKTYNLVSMLVILTSTFELQSSKFEPQSSTNYNQQFFAGPKTVITRFCETIWNKKPIIDVYIFCTFYLGRSSLITVTILEFFWELLVCSIKKMHVGDWFKLWILFFHAHWTVFWSKHFDIFLL